MPFNPSLEETNPGVSQLHPVESERSKSEHSGNSDILQDENQVFDDPQFPRVIDINPHIEIEEGEPEKVMDFEGKGLEEEDKESLNYVEAEEQEKESLNNENAEEEEERLGQKTTDCHLNCRSIRIGSYKVHPKMNSQYVPVILSENGISFNAPVLNKTDKTLSVTLRDRDIESVLVHFGRCLPIMFILTTPDFGEALRNALNMSEQDPRYFDPTSKDDKTQKLTFLIEGFPEEQKNFLLYRFPGVKKIKEMDQKTANAILVKSTPHQNLAVRLQCNELLGGLSVDTHTINPPSQDSQLKSEETRKIDERRRQGSLAKMECDLAPELKSEETRKIDERRRQESFGKLECGLDPKLKSEETRKKRQKSKKKKKEKREEWAKIEWDSVHNKFGKMS